jgi:hypothetical protein
LKGNGLRGKKSGKTGKTRKNTQNILRETPVFLPKRADFGRRNLQVADFQMLPASGIQDRMALRPVIQNELK